MSGAPTSPNGTSWRAMLEATPLRNAAAQAQPTDQDRLRIAVRTRRPWWMVPPVSWIVPLKPTRAVDLDRLGTQVWELCDGQRTVEDVVDAFAARHELTFHEARVAVTGYLKQLVQRGALAIEAAAPPSCAAEPRQGEADG